MPKRRATGLASMLGGLLLLAAGGAEAAISCQRNLVANVVAFDQPLMFNRLGAQNVNGMIYALRRDVVDKNNVPLHKGGAATPGEVMLRPDKRPIPLVLRVAEGDCLTVNLQNLLTLNANPRNADVPELDIDDQVTGRQVGFKVIGLQPVNGIGDIASNVGLNQSALVTPGNSRSYTLYAEREGAFVVSSDGATFGGEGAAGNIANGLFGQVVVLPKGARSYRNTVTEEELRLASQDRGRTQAGQPVVDYAARYPNREPWISEGKAGAPILALVDGNEIVNSAIDAVVMGPNPDGSFPPETYPLERIGKRNPSLPNRLEPFRDFSVMFQDEAVAAQAFPGFWNDPVFAHVLQPLRDGFMINYGSGGIGAEVIANRLGVGPMHDCLSCAYEEFFLSSHTVGDVGMLVDVPANVGLEGVGPNPSPQQLEGNTGIKASMALFPAEPANVHHSYIGDFVKFRNTHVGHEQHIFHLHAHQWLHNPNDDNSDYVDAQGIGSGSGYTYEIAFGGSGNRNRVAGDAIFHCHFYPHFAQGMWSLWRVHDVFEEGTRLAVSGEAYHSEPFALRSGLPAEGARALPDGEIIAGTPIPAVVPLPGKAMAPMPGKVTVVPKYDAEQRVTGSLAWVDRSDDNKVAGVLKNPGYPFWIGGIEHTVGQRPPTPPLDMLDPDKARALQDPANPEHALWQNLDTDDSDASRRGFDGGLPRHTLDGFAAGGTAEVVTSALDFSKHIETAKAVFLPEEGTEVEKAAMAFHAMPSHPSWAVMPAKANGAIDVVGKPFRTNGALPVAGAPFFEPCMDDAGKRLTSQAGLGQFFGGDGLSFSGSSTFTADNPRVYKAANIQFDAVFNKVGYHFPQARILTLWEDALPVINKQKPPEPLVMRMNTFDCTMYYHTNLIPAFYELDDYQVRTPTDVIGQHIHLPKWDLPSADGSANGWNYEDGVLSPGAVVERIEAIRAFNGCEDGVVSGECPMPAEHPFFRGSNGRSDWLGARTTMQRWFADPVVNRWNVDRGLGNIFTHDHLGPSTHQQVGLYATVLTEPAGSSWFHSETGVPLYTRDDGGPTSWQAVIETDDFDGDGKNDSFREFFLEYSDFQHAYEAGVYVGAGADGVPNPSAYPATADSFRYAINPPVRRSASNLLESVVELAGGRQLGCPVRPCPQGISVEDPGIFVVNYRNEPVALRVFDPNRVGPDGKPGMQADGLAGDLAFALQSRTDRAIPALNLAPSALREARGPTGDSTAFPPHINTGDSLPGDPFTPMLRTYSGDNVRLRVHAGGHEEEHNVTLHGVKWLQNGTGYGYSSNSGWRSSEMVGISEQLGFMAPVTMNSSALSDKGDYLYSMDASLEGYWNGMWGIMRNYTTTRGDLRALPNNPQPVAAKNTAAFSGVCPSTSPTPSGGTQPTPQRLYEVVVALANDILPNPLGLTIGDPQGAGQHVGGPLKSKGGTLVVNSRAVNIPQVTVIDELTGQPVSVGGQSGPLHDPTAIMYVRRTDIDQRTGKLKAGVPVEPLVLRAAAGDCVSITLENRLPLVMPDLPTYAVLPGAAKRDRNGSEGSTTFNSNLLRPSSHVGLHAQLLAYDITQADGVNVGINPVQTLAPRTSGNGYPSRTYQFYVGHLAREGNAESGGNRNLDNLIATPVEFGGLNLLPADPIKQAAKGLNGQMVILPQGASWSEDAQTRTAATVQAPGLAEYRDFSLIWQKGRNFRWANGRPVQAMAAEGIGTPADPEDNSDMTVNYRSEPLWYRFAKAPDAPFGKGGWADIANVHMAYSNALVSGDPQTPVLTVKAGQPFRVHLTHPAGGSRGATFQLDGHLFPQEPFLSEFDDGLGYPLRFAGIGSVRFGYNPLSRYTGAQESVLPAAHFDFMYPSAGGGNAVPGDYRWGDFAAFGNAGGLWGLLRVLPADTSSGGGGGSGNGGGSTGGGGGKGGGKNK